MKISELLSLGIKSLKKTSPTPTLDAEVLLTHVLKKTKEFLYIHLDKEISSPSAVDRYIHALNKRKRREPIAYIIHCKEFYGLDFYVNNTTLIPRPETECIIDEVKKIIQYHTPEKKDFVIADIGTGSGCLAVTLAKILNTRLQYVYATDISQHALSVARKNARRHNVSAKVKFFQGSLLAPLKNKKIDILVANLPYLSERAIKKHYTQCPGLRYEPKQALFTKERGWYWYNLLFHQLHYITQTPTWIFLEINKETLDQFKFPDAKTKIIEDLGGHERIISINFS